jgi:U4/U6.U5 tri-snRNP-associated protein 2
MNVIIHSLLHIPPLRDHLLLSDFRGKESELLKRFAGLAKKIWNPRLFKSQVSPHEFLQEVNRASAGKFRLEQQGDPVEFLGWLLNRLHKDFGGSKKKDSSASIFFLCTDDGHRYKTGIIFKTFQGELRVETQQVLVRADSGEKVKPQFDIDRGNTNTKILSLFSDI